MDDLISRQEAIAATRNAKISFTIKSDIDFANYRKEIQEMFNNILDAQEKALKELPSAQPEPQWIPCSERLPDEYGNYLISIKGEEPDIGTINPNDPRGWSLCDANGFYWANDKMLNVIAWMPLPEPYAERRTDEVD